MEKGIHKKLTWEEKFDRKYWAGNKAKRIWVRWMKHTNNKKLRRILKDDTTHRTLE